MTENKGTKILLADGTEHEIQYSGVFFVCFECGEEFEEEPDYGYCDGTLACAAGSDTLIPLPR